MPAARNAGCPFHAIAKDLRTAFHSKVKYAKPVTIGGGPCAAVTSDCEEEVVNATERGVGGDAVEKKSIGA